MGLFNRKNLPGQVKRACQAVVERLEERQLLAASISFPTQTPTGLSPQDIRHAYGFDNIRFPGGIEGTGEGQTVAIIATGDNPRLVNSDDPAYADSDLAKFCRAFNLPDPPSFRKVAQDGSSSCPPMYSSLWASEIAMDVEWVHALAPKADILLVEAQSSGFQNMLAAATWAKNQPNVSVVTLSYGASEAAGVRVMDGVFTTPAGHSGVTFVASSGDTGSPGLWPAYSPNVLAVGGTSLSLNGGEYAGETAWSQSGGGVSTIEPRPAYQSGISLGVSNRMMPDVAFLGDPQQGVAVYDSCGSGSPDFPWIASAGTSFGAPVWAALIAVVNQGRAASGLSPVNGFSQTLPGLYQLPASDFHDITSGSNGYAAVPGYDLVTGRGSPIADRLVPDLAALFAGSQVSGTVYDDVNQNGALDNYEGVLPGWTVFLDGNGNGTLDAGELSTTSNESGNYAFNQVPPGSYAVREVAPSVGWAQYGSTSYAITLLPGQSIAGCLFGNTHAGVASLTGTVYNDRNGNGSRDPGEEGLEGHQVFLDLQNNMTFDVGEPIVVTDDQGRYEFAGLSSGYQYGVGPVDSSGWQLSYPWYTSFMNGQVTQNSDVGLTSKSIITGRTYCDLNLNGVEDSGEIATGWTVYADLNNNAQLDQGEPTTTSRPEYQLGGLDPGTYIIRVILPAGYVSVTPGNGAYPVTVSSLGWTRNQNFGARGAAGTAFITGTVFNDLNGNGVRDADEPGIEGRTVYSDEDNSGNRQKLTEPSAITDSEGRYRFVVLAGTYTIRQTNKKGWHQVAPFAGGGRTVDVAAGSEVAGNDFADAEDAAGTASVLGIVFNDLNADDVHQNSEPLLQGWKVFLDADQDGTWDDGEPFCLTDVQGRYAFGSVPSGAGAVTVQSPAGWQYIRASSLNVDWQSGGVWTVNFDQTHGSVIEWYVFQDHDLNGQYVGDSITSAWKGTAFLDLNDNGLLDPGEPSSTQGSFAGLADGTYILREIPASGQRITAPVDGYVITISGLSRIGGKGFGHTTTNQITGVAFEDLNGNGRRDDGEPPLAGRTVFIDVDADGELDGLEARTTSGSDGTWRLDGLPAGTYRIAQVLPAGWSQTIREEHSLAISVTVAQVVTQNLGSTQAAGIFGCIYHDANADAYREPYEDGLAGWSVFIDANLNGILDSGETSALTNADGTFSFTGLASGTYTLRQSACPSKWTATGSLSHTYTIDAGHSAFGADFGERRTSDVLSIYGVIWSDLSGNGQREDGEPGLAGRTVYIDANQNYQFDAGELFAVSNADGSYGLANLSPGDYVVRILDKPGWTWSQTYTRLPHVTDTWNDPADFGQYPETVLWGEFFADANLDGTLTSGESRAPAAGTLFIDINGNGLLDEGEAATCINGCYYVGGLDPGTYAIHATPAAGYRLTSAADGTVTISGTGRFTAMQVGTILRGSVGGTVFHDRNGNQKKEFTEPAMPNLRVFLDVDGDGQWDGDTERSVLTDAEGNYRLADVDPGTYRVCYAIPADWITSNLAGGGSAVTLAVQEGQPVTQNVGTLLMCDGISGTVFQDLNANGRRQRGDPPLVSWKVFLDSNRNGRRDRGERLVSTDKTGGFSFTGLSTGTYRVTVDVPAGWRTTSPAPGFCDIAIPGAPVLTTANFSLTQKAAISGIVFKDIKKNGVRDIKIDPVLHDVQVFIDADKDGVWDPKESSVLTDEYGNYSFKMLPAGKYVLRVVLAKGWRQTTPRTAYASVAVKVGHVLSGVNFGLVS